MNFGFRDGNRLPLEILVLGLTGSGVGLLAVFAGLRLTAVPTQSPNEGPMGRKTKLGSQSAWTFKVVPEPRFELGCPRGRPILSRLRLPFRHSGPQKRTRAAGLPAARS